MQLSITGMEVMNLNYAVWHDLKDIDDLDEFLTEDVEECVHLTLNNNDSSR